MYREDSLYSAKLNSLLSEGKKSEFFAELSGEVWAMCDRLGFEDRDLAIATLEKFWLPLAVDLATARQKMDRTLIQGILGGQGTGKSTLCIILKLILNYLGLTVANLSIDDLYLTREHRQELKRQDPRLIWRGPPGTHDLTLGIEAIERCLQRDSDRHISLPRFDKSAYNGSGDRANPETVIKPDILLFEGWFVGVQPIEESCFNNPPHPIVTAKDIQFAKDNNRRLQAYLPLWNKLDRLIVLYPEDYRSSKQWRKEAEQKMMASGKTGMSEEEIDRFVEYFWQSLHPELFIKPLLKTADIVVEINSDRSLGRIYRNE